MSGVEIRVRADTTQAQRGISNLEKSVKNLETSVTKTTSTFKNLAIGITAAFSAANVAQSLTRTTDSFKNFQNRINLVTEDIEEAKIVLEELYDVSARARTPIGGAVETFNRFGLAMKNIDPRRLVAVTETIQKAVVISSATAESATAALVQLGQGLASGELRGQELNSVREQIPRVAQAIADGIGVPLKELKKLGEEGKLTTEVVFGALESQGYVIDEQFARLAKTIGGVVNVLKNELGAAIGQLDQKLNVSGPIVKAIEAITGAIYRFRRTLDANLLVLDSIIFGFKVSAIIAFLDVKEAIESVFGIDFDELGRNIDRLKASIESIFFKTVSTPAGDQVVETDFKEKLDRIVELIQSVKFELPEFSVENFLLSVFTAKQKVEDALQGLKDVITNVFYDVKKVGKTVGPGVNEYVDVLVPKDNFFGGLITSYENLKTTTNNTVAEIDAAFTKLGGTATFTAIKSFIDEVQTFFYDMYIYLVGNSIVPDTVEAINNTWKGLFSGDIEKYVNKVKGFFVRLYNFLRYEEVGIEGVGGKEKVNRKFFQYIIDSYADIEPKLESIKAKLRNFFEYILYTEVGVEGVGGKEKVKRRVFGFLDSGLESLKSFAASSGQYLDKIKTSLTETFFSDSAEGGEGKEPSFSFDNLLTKFNAALVAGTLGYFVLGKNGLLLAITGVTVAGSDLIATDTFQGAVKRVAKDFVSTINDYLSSPDGNLFGNVTLTIGSIGEGVKEGLGFETESSVVDAIFGGLTVAGIAALLSSRFRAALGAVVFFDPQSQEYVDLQNRARRGFRNLFTTLRFATPIVVGSMLAENMEFGPESSWLSAATQIIGFIAAGWVVDQILERTLDWADYLIRSARLRRRFRSVGSFLSRSAAAGIINPIGIAAVVASFSYLLLKGYTVAANNFMKEGNDLRLAIGLNVESEVQGGITGSFQGAIQNAFGPLRDEVQDSLDQGLSPAEIVKGDVLRPVYDAINKKLQQTPTGAIKKIDFGKLFPGFVLTDGRSINDVIQASLQSAIENDKLKEFDIGEALKNAGFVFSLDPDALKTESQGVTDKVDQIRKDVLENLDATQVLETFKNSFKALSETTIITPEQQTSVDNMTTSLDRLTKALSGYIDELGLIPKTDIKLPVPSRISSSVSSPTPFAEGGAVSGPGTGTSDDILARISNGEYIIKAASVSKYGTRLLDAINQGNFPKFANGGLAGLPRFQPGGYVPRYTNTDLFAAKVNGLLSPVEISIIEKADRAIANLTGSISNINKSLETDPESVTLAKLKAEAEEKIANAYYQQDKAMDAAFRRAGLSENVKGDPNSTPTGDNDKTGPETIGENFALDFYSTFESGLAQALATGDFETFGDMLLDQITMSIIQSFASGITDALLGGLINDETGEGPLATLFDGIFGFGKKIANKSGEAITKGVTEGASKMEAGGFGNMFSGIADIFTGLFKGIGGFFSSILSIFGGGATATAYHGGVVGATSSIQKLYSGGVVNPQIGKDSVPAMLTPGEYVLPSKRAAELFKSNNNNSQQTVVNLNVTGDISRQTKKEVMKMIPEIAAGVNYNNKENNYRR